MLLKNIETGDIGEFARLQEGYVVASETDINNTLLQKAKDSKIAELKANKIAADLKDHYHEINGSWYAFHMDLESRNLLASILSSATSILGLDPRNTEDDNIIVYSSFGANKYNHETKEVGEKDLVDLTYKNLRSLYSHMAVRLGSIYALYSMAKKNIEDETDLKKVQEFDVSINYQAS